MAPTKAFTVTVVRSPPFRGSGMMPDGESDGVCVWQMVRVPYTKQATTCASYFCGVHHLRSQKGGGSGVPKGAESPAFPWSVVVVRARTPPPLCISHALVQATVGVGAVIILYVIQLHTKCSVATSDMGLSSHLPISAHVAPCWCTGIFLF